MRERQRSGGDGKVSGLSRWEDAAATLKHSGLDMSSFHFKIAFYQDVLCVHATLLSCVQLFATVWTVAC